MSPFQSIMTLSLTDGSMQDNVALIAVLEALDPPLQEGIVNPRRQLICVANTHIHANPELNDVKLWQARLAAQHDLDMAATHSIPEIKCQCQGSFAW